MLNQLILAALVWAFRFALALVVVLAGLCILGLVWIVLGGRAVRGPLQHDGNKDLWNEDSHDGASGDME